MAAISAVVAGVGMAASAVSGAVAANQAKKAAKGARNDKQRAEAENRSIAQEAIVLLAKGLDTSIAPKERRTRLLQKIDEEAVLQ